MKKLIVFIFSIVLLGSCSKYQDNPPFSLSTKKSRLVGEWESDRINTVNVDSIDYEFKRDGELVYDAKGLPTIIGTWSFANDKEDLLIEFPQGIYVWEIYKLTRKEFWFINSSGILIELEKK
tara:strand:- start:219 stop:584 length:366 start_codon:yes stop_codon:yes gene_type:complete